MNEELWKYCTARQCSEMIHALRLLDPINPKMTEDQEICLLYSLSNHTEEHYHKVSVPKKKGGHRQLQVPDSLLKTVQRNISRHVLQKFPVSSYAMAYKKGGDIRKNALPHVGQKKLLKLDIHDFFGSITYLSVYNLAFPGAYFPPQVRTLLANLCCYRDCLPQGAPSSPYISNLVMRSFDEYMGDWCARRRIVYTRYCDDMTFSGDFDTGEVRRKVRGFLRVLGFELNNQKTKVVGYGKQQTVTGIMVNEKIQLSKAYRRNLRQEIYYCLKYGVKAHLERKSGKKDITTEESCCRYLRVLMGRIAYVLQVNPEDRWFQYASEQIRLLQECSDTEKERGIQQR